MCKLRRLYRPLGSIDAIDRSMKAAIEINAMSTLGFPVESMLAVDMMKISALTSSKRPVQNRVRELNGPV